MTYYEELKTGDKTGKKILTTKLASKTKKNIDIILSQMKEEEYYTATEISAMIGLKASRTREIIQLLLKLGKVQGSGSQRNRTYVKV